MPQITINTSALEKIVFSPEEILEDEAGFWEQRAQKLTIKWAEMVHYEIPLEKWRQDIRQWAKLPLSEREAHIFFRNGQALVEGVDDFLKKALPHIHSYLPDHADLNVAIQLTAFIPSRAFAVEDIVLNVNAPYWKDNVENIWNALVHEIFHAGYSYCRDRRTEGRPVSETVYDMLDNMFNEGICTYVAYRARPLFPAPDEQDYVLLENEADVRRLFQEVKEILAQADDLDDEMRQRQVWDRCILGRAYYVTGATMCRVIDERAGRQALIETMLQGPASFVRLYNTLAKTGMRIQLEV